MSCMKCPASMCPLIAPNGSPWTGAYDSVCPGHDDIDTDGCAWWGMACKGGGMMASVEDADAADGRSLVLGPNQPRRQARMTPKEYDCPRAAECRWQEQAVGLCPPREALRRGLDPRVCLF
jgi:hypothetical protein